MPEVKEDVQAVIYVLRGEEPFFLLIERFDRALGRFDWRLVKGTVKPGEGLEEALAREIREEVGLRNIQIRHRLGSYSFRAAGVEHRVASFLVEADPSEPVRLAPSDDGKPLRSYRWARADEALRLLRWEEEKRMVKMALEKLSPLPEDKGQGS